VEYVGRRFPSWLVFFVMLALSAAALADDTAPEIPAKTAEAPDGKGVDKCACVPIAATPVEARPVRPPIYVENWDRLAELTRSDRVVSGQVDSWVARRSYVGWELGAVSLMGEGVAAFGVFDRLATDHWTNATKWSVAGGLSVAIVSLAVAWAISPDRDDFLTVINQWNLRHPDQPLAP
jgi:hypothetical protein